MLIIGIFRRKQNHSHPAPEGMQKNPRFLRKFQICGLITLLLDIGSLTRGLKSIHIHRF